MGAILSFLGGSAFRMIWGEVSSFFSKKQDAKIELQRLQLQAQIDAAQHERNLAALKLQSELGIKTIQATEAADVARSEAAAFVEAMAQASKPTGIAWVDGWNGSIRPAFATVSLGLWMLAEYRTGFAFSVWSTELVACVVGFFFADRSLGKRGK